VGWPVDDRAWHRPLHHGPGVARAAGLAAAEGLAKGRLMDTPGHRAATIMWSAVPLLCVRV
jgi:hypothetical protein